MTKEKLITLIERSIAEKEYDVSDFVYFHKGEEKGFFLDDPTDALHHDGVFVYTKERFGGEGLGDDFWAVLSVTTNGVETFWKIPGWYNSNDGGEYELENLFKVVPKKKMITVWEIEE